MSVSVQAVFHDNIIGSRLIICGATCFPETSHNRRGI